jgi:FkbM family methyltransferase
VLPSKSMLGDFLRRSSIALRAFSDIANWREVLPRGARGDAVTEIQLRDGTMITATVENALWPHFSDIWYHLAYTKYCLLPENSLVVDIGANVGVFSLFAARKARTVFALEPASANFARLTQNVSRARNIVPLNLACGGKDGQAALDLSINPVSFSLVSKGQSEHRETVTVIALNTLFERFKITECDFLKLDCEGSEFDILLGSDPSLMKRVKRIAMEYHDHLSQRFSHKDIIKELRALGFLTRVYNQHGTYGMIAAARP